MVIAPILYELEEQLMVLISREKIEEHIQYFETLRRAFEAQIERTQSARQQVVEQLEILRESLDHSDDPAIPDDA
jgi:hemerythrin